MNGKDIFLGLKYVGDDLIEKAEYGRFSTESKQEPPRRTVRRPLLIAAIIALAAILVGCAVVYALRLQDLSIGKEVYTQHFDDTGKLIEPTEKERDIITLYGHSGDPVQLALTEWFAFLETYDPESKLGDNNPDHEEIPNQYEYTYHCYTAEMAAKVDEIAAKYDLKLLEEWIPFQQWHSDIFYANSGVSSFLLPSSGAEATRLSGMFYPPCNLDMDLQLKVPGIDTGLFVSVIYARNDYFPAGFPGYADLNDYQQWDYTSADGTPLLLALNSKGQGYIIAQPEGAMMVLSVYGNFSGSAYPTAEEIITKEQLEAAADCFDYSIRPEIPDREPVLKLLNEADAAREAENAYVPETYGNFTSYITDNFLIPDNELMYTFYDLTGDDVEELLIGKNGAFNQWLTIRDGNVESRFTGDFYLCEGEILEEYDSHEIYESHSYAEPIRGSVLNDLGVQYSWIIGVERTREQWTVSDTPGIPWTGVETTAEEAQAIIDKYPRMELDWKPLMDYPLSEDQTLGEYLDAKDVRVSDGELLEIYRNHLLNSKSMHYSHYRIMDINGDGVDDLLLKGVDDAIFGKTDFYWTALTYRHGIVTSFLFDFYLCEDGVLEKYEDRHQDRDGLHIEIDGHQFLRCSGFEEEMLEFVAYNKATASWQGDWHNEIPMTDAEAEAILNKYPRIDQGMRPIEELLN